MSVLQLESEATRRELQQLRSILRSSYGPLGIAAVFQPSPRGRITLTSSSERLLSMLRPSSPVGSLMLNSLHRHSQLHKDSGLFAGLLSIELILRGMKLGLPRQQVATVTSHALSLVCDRLCDDLDLVSCKHRLELSSKAQMTSLLHCTLCSKTSVCQLSNRDLDHLASLLLHSFLKALPKNATISSTVPIVAETVHIHTSPGRPVTQSCLLSGLLIECSQDSGGGGETEEMVGRLSEHRGAIVTALFDISLAGDLPEDFPRDIRLTTEDPAAAGRGGGGSRQELEAVVLGQLMSVADRLVAMGVKFVACQKVMHPLLKHFWRDKGVVAIDRLSAVNIGPVRDLTGGRLISSLTTGLSPSYLGRLGAVRHTSVHGKKYLVLERGGGGGGGHCSLVLCCPTDTVAEELRPLCSRAIHLLLQCLQTPYVLMGGGCTETVLSHFLLSKASEGCSEELLQELHCNEKTYRVVMRSVASSLQAVALSLEHHRGTVLTDSSSHHCWSFPPENWGHTPLVTNMEQRRQDATGKENFCHAVMKQAVSERLEVSGSGMTCGSGAPTVCSTQPVPLTPGGKRSSDNRRGRCSENSDVCGEEPKGEYLTTERQGEERLLALEKTCGCGRVRLTDLPPESEWSPLGDSECSTYVADSIKLYVKRAAEIRTDLAQTKTASEASSFPLVCDAFLPKLKAIETANDVASTLLRIALSISEK